MWRLFDKPFGWNIFAANLTMLPELLGEPSVIALYWALETELVFYFLCWILFYQKLNNPSILFLMTALLTGLFIVLKIYLISPEVRSSLKAMPYHLAIMFWGGFFQVLVWWQKETFSYSGCFM
jgi:hypothetical protein